MEDRFKMGFTTVTFLFLFLPAVLAVYYAFYKYAKKSGPLAAGNIMLVAFSFVFYAWALKMSAVLLLVYSFVLYLMGKIIERCKKINVGVQYYSGKTKRERLVNIASCVLLLGLVLVLGLLYHFKYAHSVSYLVSKYFYVDAERHAGITVPLGISFITFSAISYLADIYKSDAEPGSFVDCLLYIFFFPKIVSGPIVLWKDFRSQIYSRTVQAGKFVDGLNLLAVGFAKKVILADTFGSYAGKIQDICIDVPTAWFGWILYAMQIYYDFSGYSDIAIGVSKMFGFDFASNFNFPYRSLSITEFWRRWHISLGAFFRNYVYIPLGGNRKGKKRTLINLAVVFIVTGIWHGVGTAYILWGTIHGFCVVAERLAKDKKWYKAIPPCIKWCFTFFVSASAWQFFRYGGSWKNAAKALCRLVGKYCGYTQADIIFPVGYYADYKIIFLLAVGILGATVLGNGRVLALYNRAKNSCIFYIVQEAAVLILLLLSIMFMVSSSYNPFIYFQF